MSWSKVKKGKKPLMWWYYKILCEAGWAVRNTIKSERIYYRYLNKMLKYGFNLYGEKW